MKSKAKTVKGEEIFCSCRHLDLYLFFLFNFLFCFVMRVYDSDINIDECVQCQIILLVRLNSYSRFIPSNFDFGDASFAEQMLTPQIQGKFESSRFET